MYISTKVYYIHKQNHKTMVNIQIWPKTVAMSYESYDVLMVIYYW